MSYSILLRNVGIIQVASSIQFLHFPHILLRVLIGLMPVLRKEDQQLKNYSIFLRLINKYWLISKRVKRTNILTKIIQMIECLEIFLKIMKCKSVQYTVCRRGLLIKCWRLELYLRSPCLFKWKIETAVRFQIIGDGDLSKGVENLKENKQKRNLLETMQCQQMLELLV